MTPGDSAVSTASASETLFRIEGLNKTYRMGEVDVVALRDATLTIASRELLVILGPSGSGKSTLLNIIGGLDRPSGGTIYFRDEDLLEFDERALTIYRRNHIGFVFQFYNLMPTLTAQENVEMATEISSDPLPAEEALGLVGLSQRLNHFPSQLSGGEQQRVAIARAIAKRPEILLCDEPTGALDYSTGKIVLQVLRDVNERLGTTVILITHNAAIGGMAHRVIHMKDGTVERIDANEKRKLAEELEW